MEKRSPEKTHFENTSQMANDTLKDAGQAFNSALKEAGHTVNEAKKKAVEIVSGAGELTADVASKAIKNFEASKEKIIKELDVNKDGNVDIQDVIIIAMRIPGVRVNREAFLRRELLRHCPQEQIEEAIKTNPINANISLSEIDKLANQVIAFETVQVSGISTALGFPGGTAMLASIPTDIAQYYGYTLRAVQKLLYLYGFPEISSDEEELSFDSEMMNVLILCLGVMHGAAGAKTAIQALANALAKGIKRQLMHKALTKGTIYPIVKSVYKVVTSKVLTKKVFSEFFGKVVPIAGAAVSGAITCAGFITCCNILKKSLRTTNLCQPNKNDKDDDVNKVEDSILEDTEIDKTILEKVEQKNDSTISELTEN